MIPDTSPSTTNRPSATGNRPCRIGLLAGSGRFPILFAEKARALGLEVTCVGITHEASPTLQDLVHRFHWVRIAALGRMIRCFKRAGVQQIVMAGKVTKAVIYKPWRIVQLWPDVRMVRFWLSRMFTAADNKDDTLMLGMIREFERDGMAFDSALTFCPELLVQPGVLTRRQPSARELLDVEFGWVLAKEMGRLDVGQSVIVKEKSTVAVEAIEGTDRAILRAGDLCPAGGFTVVKVAKPQQDMRFDVPTIGPSTVNNLHKAGGRVLAVEANKTIIIDQPETVALADKLGITIVAR